MRNAIRWLAAALTLLGLEVSTRAVTLALGRLSSGLDALMAGIEFHVSAPRFVFGVVMLTAGLLLALLAFGLGRAEKKFAKVGDRCPSCGAETKRVKKKRGHRLLASLLGERVTRRQCEDCHWVGLSFWQ